MSMIDVAHKFGGKKSFHELINIRCELSVSVSVYFLMQFPETEGYQPASLRLIKEALKMGSSNQKLHAGSRAQSDGNLPRTY